MKMRRITAAFPILATTLFVSPGCESSANSDTPVATDAGAVSDTRAAMIDTNNGGGCQATRVPVALNELTPLGYAPSDLMALLGPPRAAELHYRDVTGDGLSRFPDTAATTLHVTSVFDPSRTFFVDLAPEPENPSPTVPCDDYLLLGVQFTLTSDDGAFAETLAADFNTKQIPDRLISAISIAAKDKRGTFALSTAGANDGAQFTYGFRQTFLAGAWLGRVDAYYIGSTRPGAFEGPPFAEWGSGPCAAGSTPIAQDGSADATLAAQAIAVITNAPVALAFGDGTRTVARLAYPQPAIACRVEDRQILQEPEGTILLPGPVTITTDDGRWSATLGAIGSGHVTSGALSSLRVYYNAPNLQTLAPAEFATFYGFSGVDFTNHVKARLGFGVDYDVANQRAIGGNFEIWGVFSDSSPLGSQILGATVGGP
jgi:hypothetical protein